MTGKYIYICKTDTDGPDKGKYVQPTRKVFPSREFAQVRADGVAPSRKAIVVELPEPVEIHDNYYPVRTVQKKTADLEPGDVVVFADQRDKILSVEKGIGVYKFHVERRFTDGRKEQPVKCWFSAGVASVQEVES